MHGGIGDLIYIPKEYINEEEEKEALETQS